MELKTFNSKYQSKFTMADLPTLIDDAKKVWLSSEMQDFHKMGKIIEFKAEWDTIRYREKNILGLLPNVVSKWQDVKGVAGDLIVKTGFPTYVHGWIITYRVKESKP